jgi:hypothetical protein
MVIVFIGMGLLQMAATYSGIARVLDLGIILNLLGCFIVSFFPFVGTIAGIWGAIADWHWYWIWAALLFLWPYVIYAVVLLGMGAVSLARGR